MRSSEKKRIYCVWIILQKIDWLIQVGKNNEKLILTQRPYTNSCVKKKSSWQRFFHNRESHNVNCRFCGAIHNVDWACINVLSQVIHNVNERKTVQTNMIFTLWMTCGRTLIHAQSTLWIALQNLPIYVIELTVMRWMPMREWQKSICMLKVT